MAATAANLPMKRTLLAFVTLTLSWGAAPCPNPQPIGTGTTLPELADFFFGDRDYASAILLATNSRTGATLQVFVTSTGQLLGTLTSKGNKYSGDFNAATNPQNITVRSSLGGSATRAVSAK